MSAAEPPDGTFRASPEPESSITDDGPDTGAIEGWPELDEAPDPAGAEAEAGAEAGAESPTADDSAELLALYPPVVAVVVTRNPGPWLEETLASLNDQDYPDLTPLVVDCGSDSDPSERVAAACPRAVMRRLGADAGFAAAANAGLRVVQGATFLLLCHDDVVLDPATVRVLVEEAYRSNAGIIGPKLVTAEDPEILLEVGRAIDRFGAPHTGIEPGEVDQEQHDGVRDVFYVTTATMLVRADLFGELGGFDPATFPGAEDLDLCWRARLAGARVLVAPDARVAHREAADERTRADRPDEFALARTRVRVLLTSYSLLSLLLIVPMGIVVAFVEALGDLIIGRPRRARAAVGGWLYNLLHFGKLRSSRRRAQKLRQVRDRELRELQVRSTTRFSAFLSHHLHTDSRLRSLGDAGRSAVDSMSDSLRAPASLAFLGFLFIVVVGSRDLVVGSVPAIGTFGRWPSVGDLFHTFASGWRYTGLGSASPAPPALAIMGVFGTALFGAVSLARTLVVVVAIPLGALGAYRLARRVVDLRGPALAAGLAYGINPAARNAIAQGRLGPLVLFALLPFALTRIVRLGQRDERRKGRFLRLAVLVAVLAAFYPAALGLLVLAALVLLLAVPFVGGARMAARAFVVTIAAVAAAAVLLFPWPLAYARSGLDKASLGLAFRPRLELIDVLRFHTGPSGAGWAVWGLLVGAAVPLFLATGTRLAWTARGWLLALAGWAVVWVPVRFFPRTSVLAPEAGLSLAALGLAIALGIGVSVLVDGVRAFKFGWRQPAAIVGGLAVLLPMLGFAGDAVGGRWHAPEKGWADTTLAFTEALTGRGQFRMLWVGDPAVLPLDPVVLPDGTGYSLTRNGPGDASEQWRAPARAADHLVDRALELTRDGLTNRLGRLLAPMGVKYVVVPAAQGAGDGGAKVAAAPAMRRALQNQLDLARLRASGGLVWYENLAYVPLRALVTGSAAADLPAGAVDPTTSALPFDLSDAAPVGSGVVPAGTMLWGEAFNGDWKADSADTTLRHLKTFGWSNGYVLPKRGSVSVRYHAQWQRWGLLAISVLIWLGVVWRWRRTRVRREPARAGTARARRERTLRDDPLTQVLDEDAFWWERV